MCKKVQPYNVVLSQLQNGGGQPVPVEGLIYYTTTALNENKNYQHQLMTEAAAGKHKCSKDHIELAKKAEFEEVDPLKFEGVLHAICCRRVSSFLSHLRKKNRKQFRQLTIIEIDGKEYITFAKKNEDAEAEKFAHAQTFQQIKELWPEYEGNQHVSRIAELLYELKESNSKSVFMQMCKDKGGTLPCTYSQAHELIRHHKLRFRLQELNAMQVLPSDATASRYLLTLLEKSPHAVEGLLQSGEFSEPITRSQVKKLAADIQGEKQKLTEAEYVDKFLEGWKKLFPGRPVPKVTFLDLLQDCA
jgi:hypothetical protein